MYVDFPDVRCLRTKCKSDCNVDFPDILSFHNMSSHNIISKSKVCDTGCLRINTVLKYWLPLMSNCSIVSKVCPSLE